MWTVSDSEDEEWSRVRARDWQYAGGSYRERIQPAVIDPPPIRAPFLSSYSSREPVVPDHLGSTIVLDNEVTDRERQAVMDRERNWHLFRHLAEHPPRRWGADVGYGNRPYLSNDRSRDDS